MTTTQTLTCSNCGKTFDREWSNTLKRDKTYCSRACYTEGRRGVERGPYKAPEPRTCPVCQTVFLVGGRGNADRRAKTCSIECQRASRYRSGHKVNQLSDVDASYIAAFIDGEGYIGAYVNRGSIAVKIGVANTYKPIVEWLETVTGAGSVVESRRSNPKHKTAYSWQIYAESAESLLQQISPYLRIKGDRAELALEIQERLRDPAQKADRSWQVEAAERFRVMNKRGPADGSA